MDLDVDNRFVSKFLFFKNKCLQKGEYQVPYSKRWPYVGPDNILYGR